MKGKGEEKEVVKKSVRGRINRGGIVGKEGDELTSSPRIANKGLQLNVDPRAIYPKYGDLSGDIHYSHKYDFRLRRIKMILQN